MRLRIYSFLAVLLVLAPRIASAAVEVSLPLEGFYRRGHYVPVRVNATFESTPPGARLELAAVGSPPTRLRLLDGRAAGTVPLLIVEPPRQAAWAVRSSPASSAATPSGLIRGEWRELEPEQRLVGFTGADANWARQQLFPGQSIVPIRLDPADPVPGSGVAWELLDALILDAGAARPSPSKLADLLAGGTTVVVRSPARPDQRWPWRQLGEYWVVAASPAGPTAAVDYPDALSAVQGWQADWPAPFRRRIFLIAVGFVIAVLAAALVRGRWMPVLVLVVCAGTCGGLWVWSRGRSAILERGGAIRIHNGRLMQVDSWRFFAAASLAEARVEWPESGVLLPFFENRADRQAARLSLACDDAGNPDAFEYRLAPSVMVGFLNRSMDANALAGGSLREVSTSPLALQFRRAYLTPGLKLEGQMGGGNVGTASEIWPDLLVRRAGE